MIKKPSTSAKFVGARRFIDSETGEIFDAQMVIKGASDSGFKKIWLGHILELVEEIGNAKMRVLMWLLDRADGQNQVLATYDEIAKETGVSRATVARLLVSLQDANVIQQTRRSLWRINPEVVFKGGHTRRMNVLISYRDERQGELELDPKADRRRQAEQPAQVHAQAH